MARTAALLLVLLAAALGVAWLGGWFAPAPAPAPVGDDAPGAAATLAPTTSTTAATTARTATPALPAAAPTPSDPLADRPTACLRVLDRDGKRPLAGVPVHRVKDGSAIAFTDEQGLAPVPLAGPEQLAVMAPGRLSRMVPTRPGSSETEPVDVLMARDDWSFPRALRLVDGSGAAIAEARVRIAPTVARRHIPNPAPESDAAAQRAWTEEGNIARLGLPTDFVPAAGALPPSTVRTVVDGQTLRFEAAGEYELVAATTDGRVARARAKVDAAVRAGGPAIVLRFAPGAALRGRVVDPAGAPLAGAEVTARIDVPVGTTAITDADGRFTLPTLLAGEPVALHVRHGLCHPADVGAVVAPRDDVVLTLTPLPQRPLRGRVRARPDLRPIAGAAVVWQPDGLQPISATTGADGEFVLQATGRLAARVAISASGFFGYAELVAPDAPFADYDLLPATTDERLAAGLTALLEGVTLDAAGAPVGGVDVTWTPAAEPPMAMPTGRRILTGGALTLPRTLRSEPDGSFRFETAAFGPGRLHVVGARERGVDATAIAGKAQNGFRLSR